MAGKPDTGAENRWWEYYFLRYFVGTVAGAVAVLFLAKLPSSPFHRETFPNLKDFAGLGFKEITGLAAIGFTYCYIASTPMLLVHATRSVFGLNPLRPRFTLWAAMLGVVALLEGITIHFLSFPWISYQACGSLLFLLILGIQLLAIAAASQNGFGIVSLFYWNLATARASRAESVREYVESYRHLREHGNAVCILVLESALALILLSAPGTLLAIVLLILWMIPSTWSWLIGSVLESELANAPRE